MNGRNPDYPPSQIWDTCDHEWQVPFDAESGDEVVCVKCRCRGQIQADWSVYWPTT
jgi:hypothetical protein